MQSCGLPGEQACRSPEWPGVRPGPRPRAAGPRSDGVGRQRSLACGPGRGRLALCKSHFSPRARSRPRDQCVPVTWAVPWLRPAHRAGGVGVALTFRVASRAPACGLGCAASPTLEQAALTAQEAFSPEGVPGVEPALDAVPAFTAIERGPRCGQQGQRLLPQSRWVCGRGAWSPTQGGRDLPAPQLGWRQTVWVRGSAGRGPPFSSQRRPSLGSKPVGGRAVAPELD